MSEMTTVKDICDGIASNQIRGGILRALEHYARYSISDHYLAVRKLPRDNIGSWPISIFTQFRVTRSDLLRAKGVGIKTIQILFEILNKESSKFSEALYNVELQFCSSCIYYKLVDEKCHRHPPQVTPIGYNETEIHVGDHFPFIESGDWCGEWQMGPYKSGKAERG